jgi:uncharacterized membrane protein YgdD (TMEM256/DUF423 family)
MDERRAWMLAALVGGLAVLLGAFGAHGLESRLSESAMQVYRTAVTYQFYHVLALFMVGSFLRMGINGRKVRVAGWMFCLGLLVFCGSLYALAITGQRWLGAITPLGGAALVVGWLLMSVAALQRDKA